MPDTCQLESRFHDRPDAQVSSKHRAKHILGARWKAIQAAAENLGTVQCAQPSRRPMTILGCVLCLAKPQAFSHVCRRIRVGTSAGVVVHSASIHCSMRLCEVGGLQGADVLRKGAASRCIDQGEADQSRALVKSRALMQASWDLLAPRATTAANISCCILIAILQKVQPHSNPFRFIICGSKQEMQLSASA